MWEKYKDFRKIISDGGTYHFSSKYEDGLFFCNVWLKNTVIAKFFFEDTKPLKVMKKALKKYLPKQKCNIKF